MGTQHLEYPNKPKMKLLSFLFFSMANGALSPQDRLDRVVGLMRDWIGDHISEWKRHDKVLNRLSWMEERLTNNLSDGCVLKPTEDELVAYDDATENGEDGERGLSGIDETHPFNQIFRLAKSAKRVTRLYLKDCKKFDHYEAKWDKLKNGMKKAYTRVNRLGSDYDISFP